MSYHWYNSLFMQVLRNGTVVLVDFSQSLSQWAWFSMPTRNFIGSGQNSADPLLDNTGPSEVVRHGGSHHIKNLQGEGKKGREGRKERKKGRKKRERRKDERKGEESKRERCIRPMGVKLPLRTVKRLYKTQKEGGLKKLKKQEERKERPISMIRPEKSGDRGQIEMWEYRICILFKY